MNYYFDANRTENVNGSSQYGSKTQERIGRQLKMYFAQLLDEPLPERLNELVRELQGHSNGHGGRGSADRGGNESA